MNLVHPRLHPKVTCLQGVTTPHSACALYFTDYIFQSKARDFYTNQKQSCIWLESLRLHLKGKKQYNGELRMERSQGVHCNFWDQSVGWSCLPPLRDFSWVRITFSACWMITSSNFHWWFELGCVLLWIQLKCSCQQQIAYSSKSREIQEGGLFLNYKKGFNSLTLLVNAPDQVSQATFGCSGLFSGVLITGHQQTGQAQERSHILFDIFVVDINH